MTLLMLYPGVEVIVHGTGAAEASCGSAFRWHPVLNTKMMPSKTRRAGIDLRPTPRSLRNCLPVYRSRIGINSSTCARNSSETSRDRTLAMRRHPGNRVEQSCDHGSYVQIIIKPYCLVKSTNKLMTHPSSLHVRRTIPESVC
jgi:hypothetical protein